MDREELVYFANSTSGVVSVIRKAKNFKNGRNGFDYKDTHLNFCINT